MNKQEIEQKVREILADRLEVDLEKVHIDSDLVNDLGMDSFGAVEVMYEMKEKFGEQYCDYVYLFEHAIKKNQIRKFVETHPKVMEDRIKNFKAGGYEQFVSRMKVDLNL